MKKITFISLFIATHVFFIFFMIHKHMQIIRLSFQKQKYENKKKELIQKKQSLSQQWYHLLKRSTIKKFAQSNLKMSKLRLNQINRIKQ